MVVEVAAVRACEPVHILADAAHCNMTAACLCAALNPPANTCVSLSLARARARVLSLAPLSSERSLSLSLSISPSRALSLS